MSHLRLLFLGTPEVRHPERAITFPTRKALALLIYLAVEGGLHTRDKLTTLFWPESDPDRGRASLRRTLAYVREAAEIGDEHHLIVERDVLGFDPHSDFELDLHTLQEAAKLARTVRPVAEAEWSLDASLTKLQTALQSYRGDFLDGFSLSDARAFDHWVSVERENCFNQVNLVFDRLSKAQLDSGDLPGSLETVGRWLNFYPLNEVAHRRRMLAFVQSGDGAGVRRAYEECRTILARELNAEPAPETEALAKRLLSLRTASVSTPSPAPSPALGLSAPPLVGRLVEHAQMAATCQNARRGQPQVMTLEGDPGIGKTRLAQEFLHWTMAEGLDILQGRALESVGRLPYQPLADAIHSRLAREPDLRAILSDVWLAELSRLLPELRERLPNLPPPLTISEAEARGRMFEAIARLGQILAQKAPLVLFIDDLQWADTASLDVLQYAAQRWADSHTPVLLLFTIRSEDLATPALARWLVNLGRILPLSRQTLGPLTPENTVRLVQSIVKSAADDTLREWIVRETGGHPLLIIETLKSLLEQEVLHQDQDGRWILDMAVIRSNQTFIPAGVQDLVRVRLTQISAPAHTLLTAAAVLGHSASFELLCQVADLPVQDGLPALEELVRRRLLEEAKGEYVFTHDKIREIVYAGVGEARRRLLHRRALEAQEHSATPAAELARHALQADLLEQAFAWHTAAGTQSLRLFAIRDAITYFEQARKLIGRLENQPGGNGGLKGQRPLLHRLYDQLGRAYELNDDLYQARLVYQEMLAQAQTLGAPEMECGALNRLASLTAHESLDMQAASALLQSAVTIARTSGDTVGLAETEWNLARLAFYRLDLDQASEHGQRALGLARTLGLTGQVARSLNQLAQIELLWGHWTQAEAIADEARALYTALGDRAMEADCLILVAHARICAGQLETGLTTACSAYALSQAIENRWQQANSAKEIGFGLLEQGKYAEALEMAQAGVAAASYNLALMLFFNLVLLGAVQRTLGNISSALEADLKALTLSQHMGYALFKETAASALCADYGLAGDWSSAQQYAREAVAARNYSVFSLLPVYWYETEALLCGEEAELAADHVRRLGEQVGQDPRYRIAYLRARARLAQANGQYNQALDDLQDAARLAEALGLPGQLWPIQASLGDLYQSQGEAILASQARAAAAQLVQALAGNLKPEDLQETFLKSPPVRRILEKQ